VHFIQQQNWTYEQLFINLVYDVSRHFQQYFCYIVAVSFIGGENQRKPLTCRKSVSNFIT